MWTPTAADSATAAAGRPRPAMRPAAGKGPAALDGRGRGVGARPVGAGGMRPHDDRVGVTEASCGTAGGLGCPIPLLGAGAEGWLHTARGHKKGSLPATINLGHLR